jgi:hypothetical protein
MRGALSGYRLYSLRSLTPAARAPVGRRSTLYDEKVSFLTQCGYYTGETYVALRLACVTTTADPLPEALSERWVSSVH